MQPSSAEIVLLAAFPPELEACPAPFRREVVGVGLVASALGAARVAARAKGVPGSRFLVGTCGAYAGSGLAIGDVVVAVRAHLADSAVAEGRGAFVGASGAPVDLDAALRLPLERAGAPVVQVATTLSVTTDDGLATALARATGCAVEHLEAYAVARAFADAGVPLAIVLGVANDVGARGREQWRAHHREAAANAVRYVVGALGDRVS